MTTVRRFRQGIHALLSFAQSVDHGLAAAHLNSTQMTLFQRMQRSEQLHSLNVLRDVLAQGTIPDDLAVAALLHDCGKSNYPLRVWQKTLAVLIRVFVPGLYTRWSTGDTSNPVIRACVVAERHPQWSAERVSQTGASERALWLIRHHADLPENWHNHPHVNLLRRLKQADDAN